MVRTGLSNLDVAGGLDKFDQVSVSQVGRAPPSLFQDFCGPTSHRDDGTACGTYRQDADGSIPMTFVWRTRRLSRAGFAVRRRADSRVVRCATTRRVCQLGNVAGVGDNESRKVDADG